MVLLEYEVNAGFYLVHISELENLAVVLLLICQKFAEPLKVLQVLLFARALFDAPADLHDSDIAFVLVVVGHLPVLLKEGDRSFVLSEQEVALRFCKYELIVVLKIGSMTKSRKTVFIGTVLEQEVPRVLVDLLVFRCKRDVSLQIKKGFIRVALNLKALGAFKIRFCVFLI